MLNSLELKFDYNYERNLDLIFTTIYCHLNILKYLYQISIKIQYLKEQAT